MGFQWATPLILHIKFRLRAYLLLQTVIVDFEIHKCYIMVNVRCSFSSLTHTMLRYVSPCCFATWLYLPQKADILLSVFCCILMSCYWFDDIFGWWKSNPFSYLKPSFLASNVCVRSLYIHSTLDLAFRMWFSEIWHAVRSVRSNFF